MKSFSFGTHAVSAILKFQPSRAIKLCIQEGGEKDSAVADAKAARIPVETWTRNKFKDQFGVDAVHQGVALEVRPFPYVDLSDVIAMEPTLCVVLDSIEDPRNLGRAARAAFAMGAQALIIPKDRAAEVTATAEKAAVGALSRIPVAQVTNLNRALESLKKAGLWIIGTSDKAKVPTWKCDLTKPVALVVGNEEKGLRPQVMDNCDELLQIPMQSKDMSLNAADALTVLLYEVVRQRASL
ncbi:MAG: 23S rRNA (guanosine(2251)-2'-O)-methyltransferase RlmB [Myxococcota bacterium]